MFIDIVIFTVVVVGLVIATWTVVAVLAEGARDGAELADKPDES